MSRPAHTRVRALPTGAMHIAFRLADSPPIHLFENEQDKRGFDGGHAVLSGFRDGYYIRETAPCHSLGVMLRPDACMRLFHCHADEVANRHTRLEDIWPGVDLIVERLSEAPAHAQPDVLQQILVERLSCSGESHPVIQFALAEISRGKVSISEIVRQSGYSHRRFNQLFRRFVGVPPKKFSSMLRFQRLLSALSVQNATACTLAFRFGYADQPHMSREFRRFTGMTPREYLRRDRTSSHSVVE